MTGAIRQNRGISGSTIKLIAIITMLIDHIAAVVLDRIVSSRLVGAEQSLEGYASALEPILGIYWVDFGLRLVGRIGFPLFCFLLVEGALHTSNIKKYILRLGLFALVSEIPFDIAFKSTVFYPGYQNVFFTLLIGMLVIWAMKSLEERKGEINALLKAAIEVVCLIAGMAAAAFLKTDYAAMGVLTIVLMYTIRVHFRDKKVLAVAAGCVILTAMSYIEITAFFSLIPIALYNGTKGWNIKYLFYAFYPVHLLILYGIAVLMGMGAIAVM